MSDSLQSHGLYSPWNSPGQNTAVGSLSLLQGIFPTQGSNRSPALQADSLPAEPQGKPMDMKHTCKIMQGTGKAHNDLLTKSYKLRISGSPYKLIRRNFRNERMCYSTQQAVQKRNSLSQEIEQTKRR